MFIKLITFLIFVFKVFLKHQRPRVVKAILRKKMELEKSGSLTSDYTTNLQSSEPYGTGTETEVWISVAGKKNQN